MRRLEISWARWAGSAILVLLAGFGIHALISLNPWLGVGASLVLALIVSVALEIWLKKNKTESDSNPIPTANLGNSNWEAQRSRILVQALRTLLQARSEKEILQTTLQAGIDLMAINGASFLPFDEWGQSLPPLFQGKVPNQALQSWALRLSSPEVRQSCKNCEELHGSSSCVLLSATSISPTEVDCFPLNSGGREVGVINLFHGPGLTLDLVAKGLFEETLEAAGKALENIQIRDQEISALHYLQTNISPRSELSVLLNSFLENIQVALDVDFAILYLPGGVTGQSGQAPQILVRKKENEKSTELIPDQPFMEGIWRSVLDTGQTLSLENVQLNKQEKWKSLMAVPLAWRGDEAAGVLLLGSNNSQLLVKRHQALLETLAGQAALLIQNARLMIQVEYQAVVDERTRLAREIHDGLAQTLAFLKIQAAQMQTFLASGETEKLTNTLQANYRTLSDAYIDARQAIDNLRRVPTDNLKDWISQVGADFEQGSNQKVIIKVEESGSEYPVNIQAQLIRIVQEALSNVRKHSGATEVKIIGVHSQDGFLIEIQDNGQGFSPDAGGDGSSHYGLRGMRERSESIGADFQITSQPGQGTKISVCVPMFLKEEL